ncbi:GNAT family N-acetyltransferase [Streptomyces caatingaensis]|uniref:Acetyltransferase n=1 Tax=Streptomyces caatingaensis TaxID=1678637 RepID=A0A0K9X979_9ACTN|nr:GNAT family N-acetyltransferase [Streptomyces caatingaensis]KNB49646.1 acetyltransferase [Streptomyces caatingaensis]
MADITVRPLAPDEWRLYRTVRLAALADAPYAFCSTWAGEKAFTEETWRGRLARRGTFLAEDGGEPCGLVSVVPAESAGDADLVSMWVAPSARGRGAAGLLVGAALARAAEEGFARLRLWVTEGNDPAERLYARHGFVRTGAVQSVREGEDAREFEMARTTAPAAG